MAEPIVTGDSPTRRAGPGELAAAPKPQGLISAIAGFLNRVYNPVTKQVDVDPVPPPKSDPERLREHIEHARRSTTAVPGRRASVFAVYHPGKAVSFRTSFDQHESQDVPGTGTRLVLHSTWHNGRPVVGSDQVEKFRRMRKRQYAAEVRKFSKGWWLDPKGNLHDVGGQEHPEWLVDNAERLGLQEKDEDFSGYNRALRIQDRAFEAGFHKVYDLGNNKVTLHVGLSRPRGGEVKPLSQVQKSALVDHGIVNGYKDVVQDTPRAGSGVRTIWSKADQMSRRGRPSRYAAIDKTIPNRVDLHGELPPGLHAEYRINSHGVADDSEPLLVKHTPTNKLVGVCYDHRDLPRMGKHLSTLTDWTHPNAVTPEVSKSVEAFNDKLMDESVTAMTARTNDWINEQFPADFGENETRPIGEGDKIVMPPERRKLLSRSSSSRKRYAAPAQQSLPSAMAASTSANQQSLASIAKDITTSLKLLPARGIDAVHNTPTGSRPSMIVHLKSPRPQKAVYAASWLGLMSRQPGQVVFMPGSGEDLLHTLHSTMSGKNLSAALQSVGVLDSVMIPKRTGMTAMVYDREAKLGAALKTLASRTKMGLQTQRGSGTFVGAPDETQARAAYRHTIRNYESKLGETSEQPQPQEQAPQQMSRRRYTRKSTTGQDILPFIHDIKGGKDGNASYTARVMADYLEEHVGMPATARMIRLHHADDTNEKHTLPFGARARRGDSDYDVEPGQWQVRSYISHNHHSKEPSFSGQKYVEIHHRPADSGQSDRTVGWGDFMSDNDAHEMVDNLLHEGHIPHISVKLQHPDLYAKYEAGGYGDQQKMSRRYSRSHIDALFNDSLGLSRSEAPQIPDDKKERFLMDLLRAGIGHKDADVDPSTLKPSQKEWSPNALKRVKEMFDAGGEGRDKLVNNRVTVSKDGYVLDGHHRFVDARMRGRKLKVVQVQLPIKKLIEAAAAFGRENGIERKTAKMSRTKEYPNAHLSHVQVRELRRKYKTGRYSIRELAEQYNIEHSEVGNIVAKKRWTAAGRK